MTTIYTKEDYDLGLFLTAAAASLTSNLIFELLLKGNIKPIVKKENDE